MKKVLSMLMASLLLVGCAESAKVSNSVSNVENKSGINATSFESFEEFFNSDICEKMKDEGFEPHALDYNSEKFELLGIESDSHFYDVTLREKSTGSVIVCTITYNYLNESETLATEENMSTISVEKNGLEYEICLEETEDAIDGGYSLNYSPFTGYRLAINCVDNKAEKDEILSYFNEFTLAPDEET